MTPRSRRGSSRPRRTSCGSSGTCSPGSWVPTGSSGCASRRTPHSGSSIGVRRRGAVATLALTKVLHFAAAHRLASPALSEAENLALYGPCFRGHGHNYTLEVTVRGPLGPDGMVMDADLLERTMRAAVVDLVDHHDLD